MKTIIGRKLGMTQIIKDDGQVCAVTLIAASPNTITQIKNDELDGYTAVQLGFEEDKKASKPEVGHAAKHAKAKVAPKVIREFRIAPDEDLAAGSQIDVSSFEVGDVVDVTGTSKGKGWAGTIKRHNFMRQRKTHGGKGNTRKPGSIGSMYPQRIFKGKRMAGQMGYERVTIKNLDVALVDNELGVIGLVGAVPGPRKGILMIKGVKA